jgi:hypothetical protein
LEIDAASRVSHRLYERVGACAQGRIDGRVEAIAELMQEYPPAEGREHERANGG